jgi:hypothetical protein
MKSSKRQTILYNLGGAFPIDNFDLLQAKLKELTDDESEMENEQPTFQEDYVKNKTGATDKILSFISSPII